MSKRQSLTPGLAIWALLTVVYLCYAPGQSGVFHFDDGVNLSDLRFVHDRDTALVFVASGESGTLGRPIALATFLLNLGDWPYNPGGFIHANILIHLLNGALLTWLALRVAGLALPELRPRVGWLAVSAGALWMLMPILASTSLIVIQRMTSLCGTFVFAGLLIYVIGLSCEARGKAVYGRTLQAAGIGFGTLLAVFTKENGTLLPLYALILEATVLAHVSGIARWRRLRMLLLAVPPFVLMVYLAAGLSAASFAARDFTLSGRLLTEPIILWDYLRLALLPHASAFTPFHEDFVAARGLFDPPGAFIAILAWLVLIGLAIWQRRRWPLLAFAVFWFLGGHVLESTALPLELYFEHRNYLPLVGPAIAIGWMAWTATGSWQRLAPVLTALYAIVLAVVLRQTTSLWGEPLLAAEIWAIQHPASPRAQQFLAHGYVVIGKPETAEKVLRQAAERNPGRPALVLQSLQLACSADHTEVVGEYYRKALDAIPSGAFSNAALSAVSSIIDLRDQDRCSMLSFNDLHLLVDELLANPRYRASYARSYLHNLKSRLYREQRSLDGAVRQLEAAFDARPDINTAVVAIGTLLSGRLIGEAQAFARHAREKAPRNPILRARWTALLDQLDAQMRERARLQSETSPNI